MDDRLLTALETAYAGGTPRSALLPALDRANDFMRQTMCHRLGFRNLLASPIFRLPPEILSRIFFIYADSENHAELFSLSWTTLLTVCRRWRDVCIDFPKLWSYIHIPDIPSSNRPAAFAMSKRLDMQRDRSKSYPLTVKLDNVTFYNRDLLSPYDLWLWKPDGLLSLSMYGASFCIADILVHLNVPERHRLSHFDVRSYNPAGLTLTIPEDVLSDTLTHLSDLAVSDALFSWSAIHGLRGLTINLPEAIPVAFKLQDVVDALARCPALEHLHLTLQKCVQPAPDAMLRSVSLPLLQHVGLQASTTACLYLLLSMILPPEASIAITLSGSSSQNDFFGYRVLGHRLKEHTRAPIRALAIEQPVSTGSSVSLSASSQTDLGTFDSPSQLRITLHTEPNTWCALVEVLIGWSVQDSVTLLDMRAVQDCPWTLWSELFERLPALTTIAVRPEWPSAESLLRVLRCAKVDLRDTPESRIIFDAISLDPKSTIQTGSSAHLSAALKIARDNILTVVEYCKQVRRVGTPLGAFEIVNVTGDHLLAGLSKKLLSRDTNFIQNGRVWEMAPPLFPIGDFFAGNSIDDYREAILAFNPTGL